LNTPRVLFRKPDRIPQRALFPVKHGLSLVAEQAEQSPGSIDRLGTEDPRLADKMAELRFEDMKNSLHQIATGLDGLRGGDIQDFRNAVHPWKAVTEPRKFATFDQARALHFLTSFKTISDFLIAWTP